MRKRLSFVEVKNTENGDACVVLINTDYVFQEGDYSIAFLNLMGINADELVIVFKVMALKKEDSIRRLSCAS